MLVISIIAVYFLTPIPIVKDIDKSELLSFTIYPETDHEMAWYKYMSQSNYDDVGIVKITSIDDKKEKEILTYLSSCTERKTLNAARCYCSGDVVIDITLDSDQEFKHILLGNINYSNQGYGTLKHEILNPEEVQLKLKEILDLK